MTDFCNLISYGHIDKDYDLYMSNFFGVTISKAEKDFLLNIKNNGKHFKFEYKLNNLNEILKEGLEPIEFKKESVLNYNLINYIIDNKKDYTKQYVQVFKQLSNNSDVSNEFIFSYLDTQKNINAFLNGVIKYYSSIWEYIVTSDKFTINQQEKHFYTLLHNLEFKDILKLDINDSLKNYIKSKTMFYHIPNEEFNKKLEELIKSLDIKFKLFKDYRDKITPFQFIYENSHYELNEEMINYIVFAQNDFDFTVYEELKKDHYTTILNSNAEHLKKYIDENINEYIKNVFLQIDTNVEEDEKTIIDLLNNSDIDDEFKIEIIKKEEVRIFDINSIENQELWQILLEENKLISSWENILHYYSYSKKLDKSLIVYLNVIDNTFDLLKVTLIVSNFSKEFGFDEKVVHSLLKIILECNEFDLEVYKNLLKSNIYSHQYLNISTLDLDKVMLLVSNNKIQFNSDCFKELKEYTDSLHIVLIEKNIDKYIESFNEFDIDTEDIIKLLESKEITFKIKKEIIEKIDYDLILNDKIADLLYSFIDKKTEQSMTLIVKLSENLSSLENKINIFIEQIEYLSDEDIISLLETLPSEYNKIALQDAKRPLFSKSEYNKKLFEILQKKNFLTSFEPDKSNKSKYRVIVKDRR